MTEKKEKAQLRIIFVLGVILVINQPILYAQTQEEKTDQREAVINEQLENLQKPETAKDIVEMLKERALLKMKEKRRKLLLKTKVSASVLYGFETNVNQDSNTKSDYYVEEDFSINWQPTFNKYFGLDTGYWLVNQSYTEQTDSSSMNHALNFTVNLTPFESGKIKLSPGIEYEWLWYPVCSESNYENLKYFFKFKHYMGKKWNYGGGYEYSEKTYDVKKARDPAKRESPNIVREDTRNTLDLYVTRYLGKFTFKIKGKAFINFSNDQYREYYDYESWKPSLTISRTFLKDDKLYVSFSPSFERKNYHHRLAVDNARYDDVYTYKTSFYYTLKKPFTLSFSNTYKKVTTNYTEGRYKNITNVIGLTADF